MEESEKYPLDQLVAIKQKRLEEAEKVLAEKKSILAGEEQKLLNLKKKRDEVKEHYKDKLTQFREKLDAGTATDKIQQMKQYLKLVAEDLKVEEQKVQAQIQVVATAQNQVDLARQELFQKQKDAVIFQTIFLQRFCKVKLHSFPVTHSKEVVRGPA